MRVILFIVVAAVMGMNFMPALAGDPVPPGPVASLEKDGATLTYLGNDLGFEGWRATKGTENQYFYASPDGKVIFLGLMFNAKGEVVTLDQIKRLLPSSEKKDEKPDQKQIETKTEKEQNSPKAEALFAEVKAAAGFRIGQEKSPLIYTFIDPFCIHCKELVVSALPAIRAGTLAIQAIPVGVIAPESLAGAAYLLSVPDAADRYIRLTEKEDITVMSLDQKHDTAKVQANIALMMKWKFEGTPVAVYRAKNGKIKIVQGSVDDISLILNDLK